MTRSLQPRWKLAPGISPGTSEYLRDEEIADQYDTYFQDHPLFAFDEQLLAGVFQPPGVLADLGCGTGRLAVSFAQRGYHSIAIDLSSGMLRVVEEKSRAAAVNVDLLQANLVELDALADASVDYAACLFSTLGMIRGAENRAQALAHFARILKPGGLVVLHVHNRWRNLLLPDGRRWVLANLWQAFRGRSQAGDKYYPYRGIRNFYLHVFTRRELTGALRTAGLTIERLVSLDARVGDSLARSWFFPSLRASGWMAIARKPKC
ncbi:MAG: class I SAM-dependent methyltransferase [Pirellulales bacterium]|nr:class I SAM-dependent methyltransferase [Pirellulales bacterium]